MSELSESEKRKMLRERRKQKFSNGGASTRLSKITGQQDNSFLSTESPLDTPKTAGSNDSASPALGQAEEEVEAYLASLGKTPEVSNGKTDPDLAFLEQILKAKVGPGTKKAPGASGTGGNGFDLFSSLLASSPGSKGIPAPAEKSVVSLHMYQARRLKAITMLIRWAILFPLVYFTLVPEGLAYVSYFPLAQRVLHKSNFFTLFNSLEILIISFYYQQLLKLQRINNVSSMETQGKLVTWAALIPEGVIPISNIPRKLMIATHYWDAFSMYLTDISFCLIVVGVLKIYSRLFV